MSQYMVYPYECGHHKNIPTFRHTVEPQNQQITKSKITKSGLLKRQMVHCQRGIGLLRMIKHRVSKQVVLEDGWSLRRVVFHHRYHCQPTDKEGITTENPPVHLLDGQQSLEATPLFTASTWLSGPGSALCQTVKQLHIGGTDFAWTVTNSKPSVFTEKLVLAIRARFGTLVRPLNSYRQVGQVLSG